MNTKPLMTVTERIALFVSSDSAEPRWVEIDGTGASPDLVDGFELATSKDAAVAIYRSQAITRAGYKRLAELVAIADGIAPAEEAHRDHMLTLREKVEAMEAWQADNQERETIRSKSIIGEARRWKLRALAAEKEADTLHAVVTSAEHRTRAAERDRDLIEAKIDRALEDSRRAHELRREAQAERLDVETRIVEAQAKALNVIERVTSLIPEPIIDVAIEPAFEVSTYYSPSNVPVVQIDTQQVEGRIRINLNDAPIWDGNPETDNRPGAYMPSEEKRELDERDATIGRQLDTIRDLSTQLEEKGLAHEMQHSALLSMIHSRDKLIKRASDLAAHIIANSAYASVGARSRADVLAHCIDELVELPAETKEGSDTSILELVRAINEAVKVWNDSPDDLLPISLGAAMDRISKLLKR